jgi:CxxC motif-containing protein (DUF1111 family)
VRTVFAFFSASTLLLTLACAEVGDESPVAAPGSPLPGLTQAELARFERGRAWFDHGWTPEEGLGPLYLQDRCSSCHDLPVIGGTGAEMLPLMTHWDSTKGCDALVAEGGPVQQQAATPLARAAGILHETVPPDATETLRETAPLLFGLGLIEAIPDSEIESRADPDDADRDGISGRVHRLPDGRLGRLTRRADVASIEDLVVGALITELGLTSPMSPNEEGLNGKPLPAGLDPAPDPEVDSATVEAIADFVRFLAPPAPETLTTAAARDSVAQGKRLFTSLGCPECHVPVLVTGPSPVAALSRKPIRLYSDLLLHDLGPEVHSICSGDVSPTEVRTARLMGLRYKEPYAVSWITPRLERRILAHGGEAQKAREAFERLDTEGRILVMRFLLSL